MQIINRYPFELKQQPRVVALGYFDGLHIGHRALLCEMRNRARKDGLKPAVFTFDQHPSSIFRSDYRGLILQPKERLRRLEEAGVEDLVLAPLIPNVYNLSPETFFAEVLCEQLCAQVLICGTDFTFGQGAKGDITLLRQLCTDKQLELVVVPDVELLGQKVSSTQIRELLQAGEMELVNQALGADYCLWGTVIHGQQLGRKLGFPTVNLKLDTDLLRPKFGVYASVVYWQNQVMPAVSSLGIRPTVSDAKQVLLESHIYHQQLNLYGEEICVRLLKFIRPELTFATVAELKEQVDTDKLEVLAYHQRKR